MKCALCVEFLLAAWVSLTPMGASGSQAIKVKAALDQAEAAIKRNDIEAAFRDCSEAIRLNPNSARGHYILGLIEERKGNLERAKASLLRSLALDPSQMEAHNQLGGVLLKTKALHEAKREFETAIMLGDRSGSSQYGLGLTFRAESRLQAALPHFLAAVRAQPHDTEKLFQLLSVQIELKQMLSAKCTLAAIDGVPFPDAVFRFRLGSLLLQYRMSREAELEFERAAAALDSYAATPVPDLSRPNLFLQIAQLRFNRNDYAGTLEYLRNAALSTLEPDLKAAALDLQGAALLATGDIRGARESSYGAVQIDDSTPDYVAHLVWSELMSGDTDSALAAGIAASEHWPESADLRRLVALAKRETESERRLVPANEDWHLKGEGMVCCPCKVPCPCRSNARPTYGHCEPGGAIRITQGHYGRTGLDGVTFATVSGSMEPESSPAMLYVSNMATTEQLIALERIFQSFKPLHPLDTFKVKLVPMVFDSPQPNTFELRIPGILQIKVGRQLDESSQPLHATAALDYFSNTIEYADNLVYRLTDREEHLLRDLSGRQANFRFVDLDAQDFRRGLMLIQYTDGSGYFNEPQLRLIRTLNLPVLRSYPKTDREVKKKEVKKSVGRQNLPVGTEKSCHVDSP